MFASALIVFREGFEIALIVCVILAATREIPYRGLWIGIGILCGLLGVGILSIFAHFIIKNINPFNPEIFHGVVLLIVTILIGWSVIWMQEQGKQIAIKMKTLGSAVNQNKLPLYMLTVVVGLAVLREGMESVFFIYGNYSAGQASILDIIFGSLLGIALSYLIGLTMYLGFIKIPIKKLFSISGWLLTFLAAGMAAKSAGHFVKAGWLPAILDPLWNTSSVLSQHSWLGRALSVLIGYQDHPSAIQFIFYFSTLTLILLVLFPNKINRVPNK